MKFTCTKENLSHVLSLTTSLASKQSHLPILMNVQIQVTESKVELITTNLEMAIKTSLRAKVDEVGSFTVPAKTLADYVNLLSDEQVEISLDGQELIVKSGSSSTKIKGAPADDFPVMPEVEENNSFAIDAGKFKEGLAKTVLAAAKNEIRPELSGVYAGFFTDRFKGLVLAATDSYRLAESRVDVDQGDSNIAVIIPARTAYEIIRLITSTKNEEAESQVRLFVTENQIAMRYDSFEMTSRLVDGKYPDYVQIVPSSFKSTATFPADVMIKKIKAAGLFTTTGVNAVSFDVNAKEGSVGVSSTSTQTGQHDSSVDAEVKGEENSILLNHRYVLDGLQQMDGEVDLKVNNPESPCMITPKSDDKYLYIVMPIRQ